jgi:hypothetical protein
LTKWKILKGRTKDLVITSTREIIPYVQIQEEIKKGGMIFVEEPIKRQTIHQAAKRMSKRIGIKVICKRAKIGNKIGYVLIPGEKIVEETTGYSP